MIKIKENTANYPDYKEVFNVEALGGTLKKLERTIQNISSIYSHMDETVGFINVPKDEFGQNIVESYGAALSDCLLAVKSLTRAQSTLQYLESDLDSLY